MKLFFLIIISVLGINGVLAKKVGLFASTGTFSHDLMMFQVAETFTSRGFEVVWVQIKVFEFNRTLPESKYSWETILHNHVTLKSTESLRKTQKTIWEFTTPVDLERWDLRGTLQIGLVYDMHQEACSAALNNGKFTRQLLNHTFDLIVVDYILHECGSQLTSYFDAPIIYMSNYPTISSYIEQINVPSNPAVVTSVLTSHSSRMSYFQRVKNTVAFLFMRFCRRQLHLVHTAFTFWLNNWRPTKSVVQIESEMLFFGTPFEFTMESPRPISHQIKYMGCPYASQMGKDEVNLQKELNITKLSPDGVILVSFGSVTSGEHIPRHLIQVFLSTFAKLKQTVLWQFGSKPELIGLPVPDNVYLYSWLPLQKLMSSRQIKLMVGHGGIRSLLEAIHHHIPVVGIPIQGCQPHDLKRVVDKGVAEILEIPYLTETALSAKINNVLDNRIRFKENTKKLSQLILSYNSQLHPTETAADFWLTWAVKHGKSLKANGRFTRNSYVTVVQHYYLDFLALVFGIFLVFRWVAQALTRNLVQTSMRNCFESKSTRETGKIYSNWGKTKLLENCKNKFLAINAAKSCIVNNVCRNKG